MNRICLVGNLGGDPEARRTRSGVAVARFSLAVNRSRKEPDGSRGVDWFSVVVVYGATAQFVIDYIGKGRTVSVEGRVEVRNYYDSKTGEKKKVVEVIGEKLNSVGAKSVEPAAVDSQAVEGGAPSEDDFDPFEEESNG